MGEARGTRLRPGIYTPPGTHISSELCTARDVEGANTRLLHICISAWPEATDGHDAALTSLRILVPLLLSQSPAFLHFGYSPAVDASRTAGHTAFVRCLDCLSGKQHFREQLTFSQRQNAQWWAVSQSRKWSVPESITAAEMGRPSREARGLQQNCCVCGSKPPALTSSAGYYFAAFPEALVRVSLWATTPCSMRELTTRVD